MKSYRFWSYATRAMVALSVLSILVVGCGKKKDEVYPAAGHAYMRDPVFRAAMEKQDKERKTILGERERLLNQFAALEARAGSRKAAEQLPEWKALEAMAKKCGEAFEANRHRTTEMMRERLLRAEEDSRRIERGEAVPVGEK